MRKVSDKEREKLSAEVAGLESFDLSQLRARWKLLYEIEACVWRITDFPRISAIFAHRARRPAERSSLRVARVERLSDQTGRALISIRE